MNIGTVIDKTVDLTFEYNGESVTLQVREESLSPQFEQSLQDTVKRPLAAAEAFARVIVSWDIDYNGDPFPPTVDNLKILPVSFYEAVMSAVGEMFQGKLKKSEQSANGSAPVAKLKVA